MEGLVRRPDPEFWRGKRVLVTGHTGFKGAWAARMLAMLGAEVIGLALDPEPGPSAFRTLGVHEVLSEDKRGDVRNDSTVRNAVSGADIVLHLAAQAIVSRAIADPIGTWQTNLNGTVNVLEALRNSSVCASVIVTSDKVYRPAGRMAFIEGDPLGGEDPYSASKAACELAVASYRATFPDLPPLATARAGNVIGGGDFGQDRLIPDIIRARRAGLPLLVRRPQSTRPFQHVLDVIGGYLLMAEELVVYRAPQCVNFGPRESTMSVSAVLDHWSSVVGKVIDYQVAPNPQLPESPYLALDSSLAREALGWLSAFDVREAIRQTAIWFDAWEAGANMAELSDISICTYLKGQRYEGAD